MAAEIHELLDARQKLGDTLDQMVDEAVHYIRQEISASVTPAQIEDVKFWASSYFYHPRPVVFSVRGERHRYQLGSNRKARMKTNNGPETDRGVPTDDLSHESVTVVGMQPDPHSHPRASGGLTPSLYTPEGGCAVLLVERACATGDGNRHRHEYPRAAESRATNGGRGGRRRGRCGNTP